MGVNFQETTAVQAARAKQLENREWLDAQMEQIQKQYAGQVIVVHDKKLVATASSPEEAMDKIKGKYPVDEVVQIIIPLDPVFVVPYPE